MATPKKVKTRKKHVHGTGKTHIDFGNGKTHVFTAGGRARYEIDENFVMVNGIVEFADGSLHYALLEIDESSSGEHCGTGIFLDGGGITFQGDKDFLQKLGRTTEEVFGYRYKVSAPLHCEDIHTDEVTGWSGR